MAFQKPTAFTGKLNENYVLSGIFNMIISQLVFADNIDMDEGLVSLFRVDGTMYGDTKLYYSTDIDVLWNFREDNRTLLTKMPPKDPKVQSVVIDTFKQTGITIDGTRLKQAFSGADVYGQFCSVTVGWLRDTKRVLDTKLINTYVGTVETNANKAVVEIELPQKPDNNDVIELNNWYKVIGGIVGKAIGDTAIDLHDALRDYNEYGFLRAYDLGDFILVWNKEYDTLINHLSLPQIFHKDGTLATGFRNEVINDIYWGEILDEDGTADGETIRSTVDVVIDGRQYFPSDILPEEYEYKAGEAYTQHSDLTDGAIICKLIHKRAIPFMSAMVVGTEFYNPKDLDRNHYLTWGYSRPTYLLNYPIVTFKAKFTKE